MRAAGPSLLIQAVGEDESYHLEVTPTRVLLTAPRPLGILHGLRTFLQLTRLSPDGFVTDAVTMDDRPRFPWRGLMIDAGQHFMPLPVIEQNLDLVEAAKLDLLHWDLSDDQGSGSRAAPFLCSRKRVRTPGTTRRQRSAG